MDHKEAVPAVNQPADTTTTTQETNLTTQTSETPANPSTAVEATNQETTRAAEEQIQAITPHAQPPPTYEETAPPQEKTAWQTATTQTPVPQPGQGLVVSRTVELNQLNEEPRLINCPFCYQEAMTRVQKESTSATGYVFDRNKPADNLHVLISFIEWLPWDAVSWVVFVSHSYHFAWKCATIAIISVQNAINSLLSERMMVLCNFFRPNPLWSPDPRQCSHPSRWQ